VEDDNGGKAATDLPTALWPKGASAACLALVGGHANYQHDGNVVCPHVALVVQRNGKITRRALQADDSGLIDEQFCCGYDTVAVGIKDGAAMVRVGADVGVTDCNGGPGHATLDEVLKWKGDVLTVVVDASSKVLW
jgi:hypothetical protein